MRRPACLTALLLAVGALVMGALKRDAILVQTTNARLASMHQRVRNLASLPRFQERISGNRSSREAAVFLRFLRPRWEQRLSLAEELLRIAGRSSAPEARHAAGAAYFVAGDCASAVAAFGNAAKRNARDWNDLAAATLCIARETDELDDWLAALSAADRALAIDTHFPEALFNRAAILEGLGLRLVARGQWHRYLALDPESGWSAGARQRLALPATSDTDAWKAATADLPHLTAPQLAQITRRYPECARRFAESLYLAGWAEKVKGGDLAGARMDLERIRIIGQTLERETGESLLADTVRHIDASPGGIPTPALLEGLIAYRDGRMAHALVDPASGEPHLRRSEERLRQAGSPLWKMAEHYRAETIAGQLRISEALRILQDRASAERGLGIPHKALFAHTQYEAALYEAVQGRWSVALASAREALAHFQALHERENAAATYAVLSEAYELIGQREIALEYALTGLRATAAVGDYGRARATLAALSRTELRVGRAETAISLTLIESAVAPIAPDPRHDPDMFLRRAAAEWRLLRFADSARSTELARAAAHRLADPAMRSKMLADIDAAQGAFVRPREPGRAIDLLSSAITFQQRTQRPIILPELYLERGRAYLAVEDLGAAERDFEAGLQELERQRSSVSEAELRPGIFDDAAELFDEAIALQLRLGASPDVVLHLVERGRARAVLEQINAGEDSFPSPELPRIADIQAALPPATALLEYVSLPDRLLAFVITRERAVLRTIPHPRAELTRAAVAFSEGRGASGGLLHEMLLAPIRDDLRGVTAINIVADDFLQRLPLAALFDRSSGTFLIQRYLIATSPSAGVFLKTLGRTRRLPESKAARALIFANPAIPRDEFGELPSLAAAESEAPRIARYYGAKADLFTGDEATAERFRSLAPSYDIIQFAGHGVVREREPYASALVCAATPKVPGGVTARDIARMKFRTTRAVVLAACSTMTGRNAAVEGVPSLARAFVVAGVPAVIGTLWDIEDGEAAAITRPLHQQLARGVPPAEALRAAQLAAIEGGLPPSRWSAFAVMGSAAAGGEAARELGKVASKTLTPRKPDA